MSMKEIARRFRARSPTRPCALPISWINILAGPPAEVDGRTLDGRTQWFLQLLARSGQPAAHAMTRGRGTRGIRRLHAVAGRQARAGQPRSSTAQCPVPPAPCASASTAWPAPCAPAADHPLFPRRRLGDRAASRATTSPAVIFAPAPAAPSSRSITGWRPSTSSRPLSTMRSPPTAGWRRGRHAGPRSRPHCRGGRFGRRNAGRRGCPRSAPRAPPTLPAVADLSRDRPGGRRASHRAAGEGFPAHPGRHDLVPRRTISTATGEIDDPRACRCAPPTSPAWRRRWSSPRASIRCATRARPMPRRLQRGGRQDDPP